MVLLDQNIMSFRQQLEEVPQPQPATKRAKRHHTPKPLTDVTKLAMDNLLTLADMCDEKTLASPCEPVGREQYPSQ